MATSNGAMLGWKRRKLKLSGHERLWSYIDRSNQASCWVWPGNTFPNGYGQIRINGRNKGTHRVAWEAVNGAIKSGLYVCHKCDNPLCCNPAHLFLGTQSENVLDCVKKKRARPRKGEQHYNSKLTESMVREIRIKYASGLGGITQATLSKQYCVKPAAISKIISGARWAHIK